MSYENAVAANWKSGDKSHFVMAHALDLLIEVGYQGLSMRGIADRCGMSLSNVQYYFSSKEELIEQIAERYFGECGSILVDHFKVHGPVKTNEALKELVALFLDHGQEMNDMCRVFRELWAIASRNETVSELLNGHYARLGVILAQNIQYPNATSEQIDQMVYMLLVMSEGYSVVGHSQMVKHEKTLALYTDSLEGLLNSRD